MTVSDELHNINDDGADRAREGMFDPQMSFPTPFSGAPEQISTIVKRDGREVPFEKTKIADAIFKAAESIGGQDRDRAHSLASAVSIYLGRQLKGECPTVDTVHDAVEKVLIELGHAKTALAYARYRDKRARIRRLREGDTSAFLSELSEGRPAAKGSSDVSLFVRTGKETLAEWDRAKIVGALLRETSIDEGMAALIAVEVEQQIKNASVKTLTASLIRELVDAKLIEHGLEEYRFKHSSLGVPLYDAQKIICSPGTQDLMQSYDPEMTNRALAERVKKEYALTQVYPDEAAEAHLRGDIHIHNLAFIDRLVAVSPSLEYIKLFGAKLTGANVACRPPKYVDSLLGQMAAFSAVLRRHFVGAVTWPSINVFVAPFIQNFDDTKLRRFAEALVLDFSFREAGATDKSRSTLGVCWEIPGYLADVEAVEPGGQRTGRVYGEFSHDAQRLAWAMFTAYRDASQQGSPFPLSRPLVQIASGALNSPGHRNFLKHASEAVANRAGVQVFFERDDFEAAVSSEMWQATWVSAHEVSLNLPRAAYKSTNEAGLFAELDRLFGMAFAAHISKRNFMQTLLDKGKVGPLGALADARGGSPFLKMEEATFGTAVEGLNECVQTMLGEELHKSDEAMELGLRIVERLASLCKSASEDNDIHIVLSQSLDESVAGRMAKIDLQQHSSKAQRVVKTNDITHEVFYTPSAQLNLDDVSSPMERVRLEGRLHEAFEGDAQSEIHLHDSEMSEESIARFVEKAMRHTSSRRIAFASHE